MTTGKQVTGGKWTLEDVERLGTFMAKTGISLVALPGLKMMRHPQEAFYGAVGKTTAAAQQVTGGKQPTDEEILFNPTAGLEGLSHG